MILDSLHNAEKYYNLHKEFKTAFEFLNQFDIKTFTTDKIKINDNVFAIVAQEKTRNENDTYFEAHRQYIDIQYIISGDEYMGWEAIKNCKTIHKDYDEEKDLEFFSDKVSCLFKVDPNNFAIFFPEDAHLPLINNTNQNLISKIIIKVKV